MITDAYSRYYYRSYKIDDTSVPADVKKIQEMIDYYEGFLVFLKENNNMVDVGTFCGGLEKDAVFPDGCEYFLDFDNDYKLAYGNHTLFFAPTKISDEKIKEIKEYIKRLKLLILKIQTLELKHNNNSIIPLGKKIKFATNKIKKRAVNLY